MPPWLDGRSPKLRQQCSFSLLHFSFYSRKGSWNEFTRSCLRMYCNTYVSQVHSFPFPFSPYISWCFVPSDLIYVHPIYQACHTNKNVHHLLFCATNGRQTERQRCMIVGLAGLTWAKWRASIYFVEKTWQKVIAKKGNSLALPSKTFIWAGSVK